MVDNSEFLYKIAELMDELRAVAENSDQQVIEETAQRLEGFNYAPTVVLPVPQFLRIKKVELLEEIEQIVSFSEEKIYELSPGDSRNFLDLKIQYISTMIYYFKQLATLRRGDPEAWDEVDELYVHD